MGYYYGRKLEMDPKKIILITHEIMQQTMRDKRPHFWEGDFLVCFYERRRGGEPMN